MIISHKHKFIFIKTVKTAGTSLEVFLARHCGPDDVLTLFDPPIEGDQPRHYEGSCNPISEILRVPFGPRSAWRCLLSRRQRFYNHMPGWLVRPRVPPAPGTVISSSASSATHGIRFYRITICTPTASAAPFPSINTSPGASSRSTTRATPRHPDQELSSIELFVMKI